MSKRMKVCCFDLRAGVNFGGRLANEAGNKDEWRYKKGGNMPNNRPKNSPAGKASTVTRLASSCFLLYQQKYKSRRKHRFLTSPFVCLVVWILPSWHTEHTLYMHVDVYRSHIQHMYPLHMDCDHQSFWEVDTTQTLVPLGQTLVCYSWPSPHATEANAVTLEIHWSNRLESLHGAVSVDLCFRMGFLLSCLEFRTSIMSCWECRANLVQCFGRRESVIYICIHAQQDVECWNILGWQMLCD